MTRDQFDQLTTHLHFSHLEGAQLPEDRMWRLRPVVDALNDSFRTTFVPGRRSLWKFRERLAFRTYNSTKRARFGLKVNKLCQYRPGCRVHLLFQGIHREGAWRQAFFHKSCAPSMEYGGFLDKGYQLFVDNWYTSPTLFHLLQSRKTNAVGTARLNRKFMRKDITVRQQHDWVVGLDEEGQQQRYHAVYRPYRQSGTGTSFSLYVAIVNAWAVHRVLGGRDSLRAFRLELIPELLGQFREGANPIRARTATRLPVAARRALQQRQHAISEIPDGKRRRCHWCTRQGRRRSSRSYCREYDVGLCTYGCFEAWHIL
ncbi:piggyBac transposable element-derived protein 4-like [Penaeus vannamei]|uniref:piggyBac transposable element-derived protein 4-like n=1 Tax=Penaeus vannamei TaxID=6689 RepID=UPI00387F652F